MVKEYDLKQLTNEKAEAIVRLMDEQTGPSMSLSKARNLFKPIDLDARVWEKCKEESFLRKKSFTLTDYLESLDPSENHKPVLVNGKLRFLDAFERQLMVRDIIVSGPNAVELAAFFSNDTNRTLFPEFINRNVLAGRLASRNRITVADLIADSIEIDSLTYRNLTADWTGQEVAHSVIGEGALFPEIKLTTAERDIRLQKFGGKIKGTYEYFRRVRVNQFALTLQFIGAKWEQDKAEGALDVILNGNPGNSNPAVNTNTAVDGTLGYADLVRWILAGEFEKDLLIVSETEAGDILLMDEFMDPNAGFNFQATGSMISPFNRTMRVSDTIGDDLIAAIDTSAALVQVKERSSTIVENERIADGQFEEILFSEYIAYAKMFEDASQTLDINW